MEQIKCIIFIESEYVSTQQLEDAVNLFLEECGDCKIVSMNTVVNQFNNMKIIILYK
jgi:predicted PP-loop superfamily ATPase